MNDHTTTIQLDVAHEGSLAEALAALEGSVPSLVWRLVEEAGPAGWPLVEFTVLTRYLPALAEAYDVEVDDLLDWAC